MAKKKPYVKIQCENCKRVNYHTHKSRQLNEKDGKKLVLSKFCKWDRKHTPHKETKK
ncbi:MAG: 50S ribosomal protein L33 [Candidatus Pacebacteria bacterium]|nr:50S ribosomal protein L33 [Candidatus Paceibacterota bacterium]MDD3072606.1 50S ribosomal protein L33 [Candidatus Paceibacterota bacterium]MDD3728931.1 50S ribosomal protein L33 [Candidatus Paceibacterota bacterium]MDD4201548.1 50S ribosomal protein L33 [Candidatus Paceibacterota bacterium]MDD4897392.1 50S ribosomal protein L33 [Candidatus Paceibacterota bacterium]